MPKNAKKKQMSRANDDKPNLSFILDFPNAVQEVSEVMTMGADKYARNNWKQGGSLTSCTDSLLRHLMAFHNCEDEDPESGKSHMAHVICNAAFILEIYEKYGEEFDDRDWDNADE